MSESPDNVNDPLWHKTREQQLVEHVKRLLSDPALVVDTREGRRPAGRFGQQVVDTDQADKLKQTLAELNRPDRDLQSRMPVARKLEVTLMGRRWLIFSRAVGTVQVVSLVPTKSLILGRGPEPLTPTQVRQALAALGEPQKDVPQTAVLLSTAGFAPGARDVAGRTASRTVVLVEPDPKVGLESETGVWRVTGPPEVKALLDALDPEGQEEKQQRIIAAIEGAKMQMLGSGVSADKISADVGLSLPDVEEAFRDFARTQPNLAAKRVDGRMLLFRTASTTAASAGDDMPIFQKIKRLLGRGDSDEQKIAVLSERKAALGQQSHQMQDEIAALEAQDRELREQFKTDTNPVARRRITSSLVQIRKDMERRQQLMGVLSKQINVVGTHLHNLELAKQGTAAKLPTNDEIAEDAARAEEVLADLEVASELAEGVGVTAVGMSSEEEALYEQLEAEMAGASPTEAEAGYSAEPPTRSAQKEMPDPEPPAAQKPRREQTGREQAGPELG
ncbi:MAG: hypothetical protein ACFCVE_05475 [Phycisphaerae bacterium]